MPYLMKKGVLLKKRDYMNGWPARHFWLEHKPPDGPVFRYAYPNPKPGPETWDSSRQPAFRFNASSSVTRHVSKEGNSWACGGSAPIPNCLRIQGLVDSSNKQVDMVLIPQTTSASAECNDWIRAIRQAIQLSSDETHTSPHRGS